MKETNLSTEASIWFDLGCEFQHVERHQEALAAF